MKNHVYFAPILVLSAFDSSFNSASPDRDKYPSFDKNKDLLIFQFDNRPGQLNQKEQRFQKNSY